MRKSKIILITMFAILVTIMIPFNVKADMGYITLNGNKEAVVGSEVVYTFNLSGPKFDVEISYDDKVLEFVEIENTYDGSSDEIISVKNGIIRNAYLPDNSEYFHRADPALDGTFLLRFKVISVPKNNETEIKVNKAEVWNVANDFLYSVNVNIFDATTTLKINGNYNAPVKIEDETKNDVEDNNNTKNETENDKTKDVVDNNAKNDSNQKDQSVNNIILYVSLGLNLLLIGSMVTIIIKSKKTS